MTTTKLLYLIHEAATAQICAASTHCSDPGFCRKEADWLIRNVNDALHLVTATVTVPGRGPGRIEQVTEDARVVVELDGAGSESFSVSEVSAR